MAESVLVHDLIEIEEQVGHECPGSEFAREDCLVRGTFSVADKFLSALQVIAEAIVEAAATRQWVNVPTWTKGKLK